MDQTLVPLGTLHGSDFGWKPVPISLPSNEAEENGSLDHLLPHLPGPKTGTSTQKSVGGLEGGEPTPSTAEPLPTEQWCFLEAQEEGHWLRSNEVQ